MPAVEILCEDGDTTDRHTSSQRRRKRAREKLTNIRYLNCLRCADARGCLRNGVVQSWYVWNTVTSRRRQRYNGFQFTVRNHNKNLVMMSRHPYECQSCQQTQDNVININSYFYYPLFIYWFLLLIVLSLSYPEGGLRLDLLGLL